MKNKPVVIIAEDSHDRQAISKVFSELEIENELKFFKNGDEGFHYLNTTSDKPFLILSNSKISSVYEIELKEKMLEDEGLRSKCKLFIFPSKAVSANDLKKNDETLEQRYLIQFLTIEALKDLLVAMIEYGKHRELAFSDINVMLP